MTTIAHLKERSDEATTIKAKHLQAGDIFSYNGNAFICNGQYTGWDDSYHLCVALGSMNKYQISDNRDVKVFSEVTISFKRI